VEPRSFENFHFDVDLHNSHGRGGQSKSRFERLAEEARHNYISKVIENIIKIYDRNLPLIVGGPACLKDKMAERLSEITTGPKVVRVVNIQYDKNIGLHEILTQCSDIVISIQIEKERKWINIFMKSLVMNDNLAVYGNKNVSYCLENSIIARLIVHQDNMTDGLESKILPWMGQSSISELQEECTKYGTELESKILLWMGQSLIS